MYRYDLDASEVKTIQKYLACKASELSKDICKLNTLRKKYFDISDIAINMKIDELNKEHKLIMEEIENLYE